MEQFLKITSALNDETRLRILALLVRSKEMCVCELQDSLNMGQSRLSRHLKILKDVGFLSLERRGVWAYYRISENLSDLQLDCINELNRLDLKLPNTAKMACGKMHKEK